MLTTSCKKGDDNNDSSSSGTVKDIDGNVYHTVTIGTQVWMVENLKTTKYRNGSPIPNVTDNDQWGSLSTGAYCDYNNDAAIGVKYGKLYNWYAVNDIRNIAPTDWHVPTATEWTILEDYVAANLGTSGSVPKALASKTDWASSSSAGAIGNDLTKNNSSGFTALPGGGRFDSGNFRQSGIYLFIGVYGSWWSSTTLNTPNVLDAWERGLDYDYGVVYDHAAKIEGYSVRCLRD